MPTRVVSREGMGCEIRRVELERKEKEGEEEADLPFGNTC